MVYLIGVTFNFAIKNLPLATFLDKGSFLQVHVTDTKYQVKKKKGRWLLFSLHYNVLDITVVLWEKPENKEKNISISNIYNSKHIWNEKILRMPLDLKAYLKIQQIFSLLRVAS